MLNVQFLPLSDVSANYDLLFNDTDSSAVLLHPFPLSDTAVKSNMTLSLWIRFYVNESTGHVCTVYALRLVHSLVIDFISQYGRMMFSFNVFQTLRI